MLKTFKRGGIHPEENKFSANNPIETMPLPKKVFIPISQHIGAPAQAIVAKGDLVKVGQIIAKSGGFVSANIHSSVSGKVNKIDKIVDSTGYKQTCIIIDADGNDEWLPEIDKSEDLNLDYEKPTNEEIIQSVTNAGIAGMGGATFPTQVKLSIPPGKTCTHLVINGVECEPYLTADHRIMLEKPEEIIIGCKLIQRVIKAEKIIIGIENNKKDAIKTMTEIASKYENVEIQPLKVQYPQGGEKQLIKAVVNREVPSGGLPIDVGCVVQNVGTVFAVYEAVLKNKPLFERIVTVTGKSVTAPKNLKARVGTPFEELINLAGGTPEDTEKIISGGPMMGKTVTNDKVPVTKGTSGILLMPNKYAHRKREENCIRCARCLTVCPMGLEPYQLKNLVKVTMFEELQPERVLDCIECGSCSYTCPAGIPLLDYIRIGKSNLNKILRSKK